MRNWAGNHVFRARRLLEPRSMDELRSIVAGTGRLRPIGTRHSFNDIADTDGDLVSVAGLPRRFEVDGRAGTLTIDGGARYGDICEPLHRAGFAMHNLPSLPHISVAGACATGTHGSGDRHPGLASAVVALDLLTPDGELRHVTGAAGPGDIPLEAAAVSLGALGVVTSVTMRVEPTFDTAQEAFEHLPIAILVQRFDEITALGESVSLFTGWRGNAIDQVWVKRRVPATTDRLDPRAVLRGATPASRQLHPIRGMDPEAATPQLGVPGPWHERLPHFRLSHTPSSGDELQSEYFVPRSAAVDAFLALLGIRDEIAPLTQVSEIRTIAADDLWLSPAEGRETVAFHFTWVPDVAAVAAVLPVVESVLEPFAPRPHWAKLSAMAPATIRSRYDRLPQFEALARRLDPERRLRNAWLDRLFGPGT